MDCCLRYDQHMGALAHQASLRVSALRRMASDFDPQGILTLYRAQVRPCMEYGALSWMSSAATHMQRLDAVQRRALLLVGHTEEQPVLASVTSLEHRRDVSALVVCHKAQVQEVPHLGRLRFPLRAFQRETRTALSSNERV